VAAAATSRRAVTIQHSWRRSPRDAPVLPPSRRAGPSPHRQPLEQALPVLLAAGQDISIDQARLLNVTLNLLGEAYRALNRETAIQAVIDAIRASDVPDSVEVPWPVRKPDNPLLAELQAAAELAESDPGRGAAALQEVLDAAAGLKDYPTAWAASRYPPPPAERSAPAAPGRPGSM